MINGARLLAECRKLSNAELIRELRVLAVEERLEIVKILARLAEMDRRELAEETGCSSLFRFCVRELRFCEGTAYYRTKAAQACAKFPGLFELLESGELSVTTVALLAKHLTGENHERLIQAARGADRRDIERLLAGLHPQAKPPERSRVIAVKRPPGQPGARPSTLPFGMNPSVEAMAPDLGGQEDLPLGTGLHASRPEPSSKESSPSPSMDASSAGQTPTNEIPAVEFRTEHRFTLSDATEAKLARARELLSHKFPKGDIESIFDAALDALLAKIDPERRKAGRPAGRTQPMASARSAAKKRSGAPSRINGGFRAETVPSSPSSAGDSPESVLLSRDGAGDPPGTALASRISTEVPAGTILPAPNGEEAPPGTVLPSREDAEAPLGAAFPPGNADAPPAASAAGKRGGVSAMRASRRIPSWVRRKVRERDQDRCAYVSREGIRCGERRFLQFDHILPWSRGGRSDDPDNIRQLCAGHNQWLGRRIRDGAEHVLVNGVEPRLGDFPSQPRPP